MLYKFLFPFFGDWLAIDCFYSCDNSIKHFFSGYQLIIIGVNLLKQSLCLLTLLGIDSFRIRYILLVSLSLDQIDETIYCHDEQYFVYCHFYQIRLKMEYKNRTLKFDLTEFLRIIFNRKYTYIKIQVVSIYYDFILSVYNSNTKNNSYLISIMSQNHQMNIFSPISQLSQTSINHRSSLNLNQKRNGSQKIIYENQNVKNTSPQKIHRNSEINHHFIHQQAKQRNSLNNNEHKINLITRACYISPEKYKNMFQCSNSYEIMENMQLSILQQPKREKSILNKKEFMYKSVQNLLENKNQPRDKKLSAMDSKTENKLEYSPKPHIVRRQEVQKISKKTGSNRYGKQYDTERQSKSPKNIKNIDLAAENKKLQEQLKAKESKIQELNSQNKKLQGQCENETKHRHLLQHMFMKLKYEKSTFQQQNCSLITENQKLKKTVKILRDNILNKNHSKQGGNQKTRNSIPAKFNFRTFDQNNHDQIKNNFKKKQVSNKENHSQNSQRQNQNQKSIIKIYNENTLPDYQPTPRRIMKNSNSFSQSFFELSPD